MPGTARRLNQRARGGTRELPSTSAAARKPKATAVMPAMIATVGSFPSANSLTTVRMIRPRMSSITAAPSTIWLSGSRRATQVVEHSRGNAHAGGGERGPGNDTNEVSQAKPVADEISAGKGKHHPGNGHRRRRRAGPQQLHEVGFQADLEQQDHHPDFLQKVKDSGLLTVLIAQIDQPQDGSPQ